MRAGRSFGVRIGKFLLFVLLTVLTVGAYIVYFVVTRAEERNELLDDILAELQRGGASTSNISIQKD